MQEPRPACPVRPPQGLLDAIAAAEAVGLTATTMPANGDVADGGAGPSAA